MAVSEKLKKFTGLVSSADVIFKDNTCREIDEEAMVKMWKYLIDCGTASIMPYEEPQTLTTEERIRLIDLLVETCKGTDCIPTDHLWADSTADAIRQAQIAKDHGLEAVLLPPPNIPGYQGNMTPHYLAHYQAVNDAVDIPIILMGGAGLYGNMHMETDALCEIITKVENVFAVKVAVTFMEDYFEALKAIKAVAPDCRVLKAGSFYTADVYLAGGDGNLSGQLTMAKYDCEIHRLWKEGKLEEAKALCEEVTPLGLMPYTYDLGTKSVPFFETNFKAMSWLAGLIDVPGMRRPYIPTPLERLQSIAKQLKKMGIEVVRKDEEIVEWPVSEI